MNKQRIREDFSRAAIAYDAHAPLQKEVAERLYHEALHHFPNKGIILDAGCGTGSLSRENSNRNNWKIIQCDSAFGMCQIASGLGVSTVSGDIETLPIADASLDGIYSSLALQWVSDPTQAVQELFRTLKPGGKLVLSTFGKGTLAELHQAIGDSGTPFIPHDFLTEENFRTSFVEAGFEAISIQPLSLYTYHPNVVDLLKSMKCIGAGAKSSPAFTSRTIFQRLEAAYPLEAKGLKASWNILILTAARGKT